MDEFFADGGTTSFVDRLTASLGIHASQVKIVSVYEGSLVVNYELEADDTDALAELEATQNDMFASGSVDLGAPVLEFAAAVATSDTSASSYEPVTITVPDYVADNVADAGEFNANIDIVTEENVSYNNVTIKIEKDPESVFSYKQQTVVVEGGPEIIHLDREKDPYVIIVPIALSVIIVLLAAVACRYCVNRSKRDFMDAEKRAKRAKDFKITPEPHSGDILGEKELAELKQLKANLGDDLNKGYGSVNRASNANSIRYDAQNLDEYEIQYDPNNDFAIFGIGNQAMGGV